MRCAEFGGKLSTGSESWLSPTLSRNRNALGDGRCIFYVRQETTAYIVTDFDGKGSTSWRRAADWVEDSHQTRPRSARHGPHSQQGRKQNWFAHSGNEQGASRRVRPQFLNKMRQVQIREMPTANTGIPAAGPGTGS